MWNVPSFEFNQSTYIYRRLSGLVPAIFCSNFCLNRPLSSQINPTEQWESNQKYYQLFFFLLLSAPSVLHLHFLSNDVRHFVSNSTNYCRRSNFSPLRYYWMPAVIDCSYDDGMLLPNTMAWLVVSPIFVESIGRHCVHLPTPEWDTVQEHWIGSVDWAKTLSRSPFGGCSSHSILSNWVFVVEAMHLPSMRFVSVAVVAIGDAASEICNQFRMYPQSNWIRHCSNAMKIDGYSMIRVDYGLVSIHGWMSNDFSCLNFSLMTATQNLIS